MVRKLMKHDLRAIFRSVGWVSLAVVIFAVISRLLLTELIMQATRTTLSDSNLLIITIFIVLFYILSICALVAVAWGVSVHRFYKSLFSGEGYLTLALPVTAGQIIWSKLLSALIAMAYAAVISLGSLIVLFTGIVGDALDFPMLFETLVTVFQDIAGTDILYLIEMGILALAGIPMSLLVIYAGISMGQFFTSHRLLFVMLLFIALYIVGNVVSVLFVIPFQGYLQAHIAGAEHIIVWIRILFDCIVDVGCFFLVRYILRNKVNLIA